MTREQKLIKKIIKYKKYFSEEEFKTYLSYLIIMDYSKKINSMINKYIQPQLDKILKEVINSKKIF